MRTFSACIFTCACLVGISNTELLMPPPYSKGPTMVRPPPVTQQIVLGMSKEMPEAAPELVMYAPPAPSPKFTELPPNPSPYLPPTYISMAAVDASPIVIHAMPQGSPGFPSILPTKQSMGKQWNPVAVLAGPRPGQFHPVGHLPSKEGPRLPHYTMRARPVHKGEM